MGWFAGDFGVLFLRYLSPVSKTCLFRVLWGNHGKPRIAHNGPSMFNGTVREP